MKITVVISNVKKLKDSILEALIMELLIAEVIGFASFKEL